MKRKHYVYMITNDINGKKYIGKRSCSCSIKEDKYMGSGIALNNAFKKYGKKSFSKTIIEELETEEEAFEREIYWIKYYNAVESKDFYNIKDGGQGNSREDAIRNNRNLSPEKLKERSRKLSIANSGSRNSMYGKLGKENPVSKSVVMIDSNGQVIKKFDSIADANNFIGVERHHRGISRSCVTQKGLALGYMWLFFDDYNKMIESNTYKEWFFNMEERYIKKHIKKVKAKKRNATEEVYQLDKDSLEIIKIYPSISEASLKTNISRSLIARNVKHGSNTAGGYSWCLKKEYDSLSKEEIVKLYSYKYVPRPIETYSANKVKVVCLNTNQVFSGVKDAIEYFGLCKGTKIASVCKKKRKSAGKHNITGEPLTWAYYDTLHKDVKSKLIPV